MSYKFIKQTTDISITAKNMGIILTGYDSGLLFLSNLLF